MKKYMSLIALCATFVVVGCSTLKAQQDMPVDIESSRQVAITNVAVIDHDGTVAVSGILHPISTTTTRTGHVDVSFLDAEGEVLYEMRVAPNVKMFSRKSSRSPSFEAMINADSVASVRVTHHPDVMHECEM